MKKAFTLAEVMIVLVILGVVAALTVPSTIKHHKEAANRVKLKKAMAVYENVLSSVIVENDIKNNTDLINYICTDSCKNASKYFKQYDSDGCIFKTADGVYWDISDITKPLIGFNYDDIHSENAKNKPYVYHLVGHFDNNGNFRANDKAYEIQTESEDAQYLANLYDYVGGKINASDVKSDVTAPTTNGGTPSNPSGNEPQTIGGPWVNDGEPDTSTQVVCDSNGENCRTVHVYDDSNKKEYDDNGNIVDNGSKDYDNYGN